MVNGNLGILDILIFAGVAAFLIYRLRNVLGKRTGFEKKSIEEEVFSSKKDTNKKEDYQLKDNEVRLSDVYDVIPDFDHKIFLDNAKYAFETIINAFNKSDKKTLKNLLTKDVYVSFDKAINESQNNPNFQFYSLAVDSVEDVLVVSKTVSITIKITSEQFKDGDESTVIKKQDTWTFQKDIDSKSPIWLLSST